jgi:hypothetical protein
MKLKRKAKKSKVSDMIGLYELAKALNYFVSNPIHIDHHLTKENDPTPLLVHLEFTRNGHPAGRQTIQEQDCKGFPITLINTGNELLEVAVRLEKRTW